MFSHIVAMGKNRVIGNNGTMPWHLPEDLQQFKNLTMGKPILMGRKTFASLGRVLPGRRHIVVSRSSSADAVIPWGQSPDVVWFQNLEEARRACEIHADEWGPDVFIIGGGEIYRQTLPWVRDSYITEIEVIPEGDTLYPELPLPFWHPVHQGKWLVSRTGLSYRMTHLQRTQ